MNSKEHGACARLFEAVTEYDEPQKAFDKVLGAICDIVGSPNGGMWGVPQDFLAAPRLSDVSYVDPNDGCREIHSFLPLYPAFNYMVSNWQSVNVFKPINVIGWNAWTNSGFYQDYLCRYDRKDNIVGVMRSSSGAPRWFYSMCHEGRNAIKPGSQQILSEWTPRVAQGLENLERWRNRLGRIETLELIAQNTSDALIALRTRGAQPPMLVAASAAASRVLAFEACVPEKNLEFQELLRLSRYAGEPGGALVIWQSRSGQEFSLQALRATNALPDTMLLRLVPIAAQPSVQVDREAALRCGLSKREAEIFALLAKGLGNREIGRELHISPNTARTHIDNIYAKLKVSNRVEAVNHVRSGRHGKITPIARTQPKKQGPGGRQSIS
jgi:DNA-binding CsgD family transcriptional regulator